MIFACLQIFGILCSQVILVKRSANQVSALNILGQFLISFASKHRPLRMARLPGDEDLLLSFDVPDAILRVLYVRKPCLLELW